MSLPLICYSLRDTSYACKFSYTIRCFALVFDIGMEIFERVLYTSLGVSMIVYDEWRAIAVSC